MFHLNESFLHCCYKMKPSAYMLSRGKRGCLLMDRQPKSINSSTRTSSQELLSRTKRQDETRPLTPACHVQSSVVPAPVYRLQHIAQCFVLHHWPLHRRHVPSRTQRLRGYRRTLLRLLVLLPRQRLHVRVLRLSIVLLCGCPLLQWGLGLRW